MRIPKAIQAATSTLAILWASGAMAQTATPPAEGSPSAGAADNTDIVVTAQRRSERLVDVPLSVAAVSSEEIERAGATSLENLTKVVPGVYMQRDVYGLSPTVRGIGSTLPSSGGEANVSVYVDQVYLSFRATNIFDLASVANVQVLKGPQGTLFGRNATGGAVLITTLDPSFDVAAKVKLSYERFGQVRASGYVNAPLTDTIAANAAVSYRHSRGYIRDNRTGDIVNEGEDFSVRGKLLFQPTDALSFIVTGYHSDFDDPTGASYQAIEPAPFYTLPSIPVLPGPPPVLLPLDSGPIAYDRFHRSQNIEPEVKTKADMFSLHAAWDLEAGKIQSITAYQKGKLTTTNDLDASYQSVVPALNLYASFRSNSRVFTQEVNFTSKPGSDLEYVAGIFYYRARSGVPYFAIGGAPTTETKANVRTWSAYFDGSWRFGDVIFIGGLRYTREKRDVDTTFLPSLGKNIGSEKEGVWTPRVGIRYELTPESNLYATYTRGYKAGVFDATSPIGNKVDPEYVNAYEVGYKLSQPGFTLNTAAYYYDFTDTQVTAIANEPQPDGSLRIFSQLYNVPKTQIYGFEVESTFRISDAFDVRGSIAYTHARYKEFTNAPAFVPGPLLFDSVSVNANGNHAVRAPDFTASGAVNYHHNLGDMKLDASLSGFYSSRVYFDFPNDMSQAGYLLVDANVTLTVSDHLTASIFGRNLTDKVYYNFKYATQAGRYGVFGMPRTYGVSLGYSF